MRSADSTITRITISRSGTVRYRNRFTAAISWKPMPPAPTKPARKRPDADDDRTQAIQWLTAQVAGRPDARRLVLDRIVIARQTDGAFRFIHAAPSASRQRACH